MNEARSSAFRLGPLSTRPEGRAWTAARNAPSMGRKALRRSPHHRVSPGPFTGRCRRRAGPPLTAGRPPPARWGGPHHHWALGGPFTGLCLRRAGPPLTAGRPPPARWDLNPVDGVSRGGGLSPPAQANTETPRERGCGLATGGSEPGAAAAATRHQGRAGTAAPQVPGRGRDDPPPGARVPVSPNPKRVSRVFRLQPRFVILKSPVMVRQSPEKTYFRKSLLVTRPEVQARWRRRRAGHRTPRTQGLKGSRTSRDILRPSAHGVPRSPARPAGRWSPPST